MAISQVPSAIVEETPAVKERIFGLDFLRALAIVCVLIAHGSEFLRFYLTDRASNLFFSLNGFLGVEIFFVLSGFLIGGILLSQAAEFERAAGLLRFWVRRWLRTLPNYFLFVGANAGLWLLWSGAVPNIKRYLVFLQNFYWQPPAFFPESWSLAIEEWFYLLFPLCVILGFRVSKSFNTGFAAAILFFLLTPLILRLANGSNLAWEFDADIRKVVLLRLDALMYGVAAAWLKVSAPDFWRNRRQLCLAVGLGLLGLVVYLIAATDQNTNFFSRTFLFSLTSLSVALLLPASDKWIISKTSMPTAVIRSLAIWSYSLYLCHLTIRSLLLYVLKSNHGRNPALDGLSLVAFVVLSVMVAAAVYRFFEKPIMDFRDRVT